MRSLHVACAMSFAAAVLLSALPARAAADIGTYNRALRCAANAEFMIRTTVERDGEQPADWTEKAKEKSILWRNVATGIGKASPGEAGRDFDVLLTKVIPEELRKREKASDPARDDPFTDSIVRFHEGCIMHPPAPPDKLQIFERWITCSAVERLYGYTRPLNEPKDEEVLARANKMADYFVARAADIPLSNDDGLFQLMATKDDAFFAHDTAVDRRRKYYERLSEPEKQRYRTILGSDLLGCLALVQE